MRRQSPTPRASGPRSVAVRGLEASLARVLSTLAATLLAGCIVVPRSAEVYDPQCRTMVRQMVLETAVIGTFGHCQNDGCVAMLATLGIVTAASAVVSGSVAVIGNIVYWAERQGRCPREPADAVGTPQEPGQMVAPARPPRPPRPPIVPGIVPFPAPASAPASGPLHAAPL